MNRTIYLTFDDGPDSKYTEELLDLLIEQNIKATFFVIAEFAAQNPEIIKRMLAEKHSVQIHANTHVSALLHSRKFIESDLERGLNTLFRLGAKPRMYRPPWGHTRSFSNDMARNHGLQLVKWDIMAQDWKANISSTEIARRIINRTDRKQLDSTVICLHDGRGSNEAPKRTIEALRTAIPDLKNKGYRFEVF